MPLSETGIECYDTLFRRRKLLNKLNIVKRLLQRIYTPIVNLEANRKIKLSLISNFSKILEHINVIQDNIDGIRPLERLRMVNEHITISIAIDERAIFPILREIKKLIKNYEGTSVEEKFRQSAITILNFNESILNVLTTIHRDVDTCVQTLSELPEFSMIKKSRTRKSRTRKSNV